MVTEKINSLGFVFDEGLDVKGRISVSDLFPKSKQRCGVYLIKLADQTLHIGHAFDMVNRFAQHLPHHTNMEKLWFQPMSKELLDETEQKLIEQAKSIDLVLSNKLLATDITGATDLDLLIPLQAKNDWLKNGIAIPDDGVDLYANIDAKRKVKYREDFEKLAELNIYIDIHNLLTLYITKCIPAYKKTEMSFWSLICMPSTNSKTLPRYFCLSINAMEVFAMGYEKATNNFWCFIVPTAKFYTPEKSIELDDYESLTVTQSDYKAAGEDQIKLEFSDIKEFEILLSDDKEVVSAIKEMNLRLMRNGGTIYSAFHCFDLAKDIFERIN